MMYERECNGRIFFKMQLKIPTSFLGCIRLHTGVKWCKIDWVKDKVIPTLTFFGLSRG